jgi:hypothetical protein
VYLIDAWPGAEMHLGGPAVETRDAVHPQPVVHVGVVAGPEERLGVAHGEVGIQVRDDSDLVLPADHREDGADRRIREGGVDVSGTLPRGRSHLARRRILDRHQASHFGKPADGLFVHCGKDAGCCKRR